MSIIKKRPKAESEMLPAKDLAMAYSVKAKAKKKMAEGGPVVEKRATTQELHDDAKMERQNDHKKPEASGDKVLAKAPMFQARKGLKTTPIKHPSMVPSSAFSSKLRTDEDHLQESDKPEAPQKDHFERVELTKSNVTHEEQEPAHHKMARLAEGGLINEEVPFSKAEDDMEEEYSHADSEPVVEDFMDDQDPAMYADGGEVEEEEEHHASIAAAVMAKRRKMAEGGQVDLYENAEEEPANPDTFDKRNAAAVHEDIDEAMHPLDHEPMGSMNDEHEASEENKEDSRDVFRIRRIMSKRSPITR